MKLDRATAAIALGVLAVLAVFGLGALSLTPAADRTELLRLLGQYVAPVFAALAALVAAKAAHDGASETSAQTPLIQRAVHQTNGALDQRFRDLETSLSARIDAAGYSAGADEQPAAPALPEPAYGATP